MSTVNTKETDNSIYMRPSSAYERHTMIEHNALDHLVRISLGVTDLEQMLNAWKESAETTLQFIKDHIRIIGEHEIKGYAVVKEKYQKAVELENWLKDLG